MRLYREILEFLTGNAVKCETFTAMDSVFIRAESLSGNVGRELYIIPAEICARSPEEAINEYRKRAAVRDIIINEAPGHKAACGSGDEEEYTPAVVSVAEDRWKSPGSLYRARLMAHLGRFRSVFARNCEIKRIDRPTAERFLRQNHSYGSSSCRHCYGLSEKENGGLIAVATFSNARRWVKDGASVRSYEWVRYASPDGTRVVGGMGKLLKRFIRDIAPDDIMSYADLEWSDGAVYRQLGFAEDGVRPPVLFTVNPETWERTAVRHGDAGRKHDMVSAQSLWFMNDGSIKYRLKLTCYPDRDPQVCGHTHPDCSAL